jgi:hypothetical protein
MLMLLANDVACARSRGQCPSHKMKLFYLVADWARNCAQSQSSGGEWSTDRHAPLPSLRLSFNRGASSVSARTWMDRCIAREAPRKFQIDRSDCPGSLMVA